MKKTWRSFRMFAALLALAAVVLGGGATSAMAGANFVSDDGGITATPAGPERMAARPWTREEMLAAKPYPLEAGQTDAVPAVGLSSGADGAPGFVTGGRPGTTLASKTGTVDGFEDLLGASTLGYAYPPPFTRQDLRNITYPYSKWPFITIGKLFFKQGGLSYVCSASVIGSSSASRSIITAGHCLHKGDGKTWSTSVVFVPGYNNGAAPFGQWSAQYSTQRVFTSWATSGDLARDVAGAKLYKNAAGQTICQKVGWLGFAWNWSRNNAWWQIGYPQAAPFDGKWMMACQASYAYDSPFGTTPDPMGVGCDQTGGTSGGPWVLKIGSGNWVNGVQSHRRSTALQELYSPYFDTTVKTALFDLLVIP